MSPAMPHDRKAWSEMLKKYRNSVLPQLFSYLKPFKKEFLAAGFLLVLAAAISFLQPLIIQQITDAGMLEKNMTALFQGVAALAALILLNQGAELAQSRLFIRIHNRSYYSIFQQAFHKLLHLKKNYFEDKNNAEILSYLQTDVSQVSSITDRYTITSISYVFRIISGLAGLILISWKLTLLVLAIIPAKLLLVRYFSKRREKAMEELLESSRDFSRWFGDNLDGIDEIKLWNLFESRGKAFQAKQKEILRLEMKNSMIDAWNTFAESLLQWSISFLIYLVGGVLVCQDLLSIGSVFAFSSYSLYVTGPISALLNLKLYFSQITPSAKRLFHFLDMETEPDEGTLRPGGKTPRLAFRRVAFSYNREQPVLEDVSFSLAPGEKAAIIGANGSGKSTILNLLLRFRSPSAGEITADGVPVSQYDLEEYRSLFSVVSQNPTLFFGDIGENIDLTGSACAGEIEAAMETSGVSGFLGKLPEGEKTQIGRNGTRLSGGEKQKLAVARALLKNAPVVILDEATSGFDVESDAYLHHMIVNHMKEKTVLMVTHHYQNLEGMDRVYRLEKGRLREVDWETERQDTEEKT